MTQITCLAETDREELSMNQTLMEGIMAISWGTWPTVVYSFLRPAWTVPYIQSVQGCFTFKNKSRARLARLREEYSKLEANVKHTAISRPAYT